MLNKGGQKPQFNSIFPPPYIKKFNRWFNKNSYKIKTIKYKASKYICDFNIYQIAFR